MRAGGAWGRAESRQKVLETHHQLCEEHQNGELYYTLANRARSDLYSGMNVSVRGDNKQRSTAAAYTLRGR